MRTRLVAAAAMTLTMLGLGSPALATTAADCQALIADLQSDTVDATSLSNKDEAGLVTKAATAAAKLNQGKTADALTKLANYSATLDGLHAAAKPKISQADYDDLSAGVTAATECVAAL